MRLKAKQRIPVYYDNTEMWNSQNQLISEEGSIYVYTDYQTITHDDGSTETIRAIKQGDGVSYLIDMPFLVVGDEKLINLYIRQAVQGEDTIPLVRFNMEVDGESLILGF